MSIENIYFETKWNDLTIHLANPEPTTTHKVQSVALNIFSILIPPVGLIRLTNYAVSRLANRMTLPAAHLITKERFDAAKKKFQDFWSGPLTEKNQNIRSQYTLIHQTVITPDGAALKAVCMRHNDSNPNTPTVIYFNGNFQISIETPTWILDKAIESNTPCNLVLFDYRTVGESKGEFKEAKDLIVDGSSIVEWVKHDIGTIPSQIHFYGFSLGGAISSLTKALDPEHLTGRLINDRSFSSSAKVIEARYGSGFYGYFMNWLFTQQGYSADPAVAFRKVQGEKLIIYHPDDAIIPTKASMQYAVQHDLAIRLEAKPGFEEQSKQRHHVAPLHWHVAAVERVVEFLFPFTASMGEAVV